MRAVLLACLAGTLLALAFPYTSFWPLAWVGLVPLLVALKDERPTTGFALGYVFGLVFMGITLRWCAVLALEMYIPFVLVESVLCGVFGLVASLLVNQQKLSPPWRALGVGSAWTLLEFLREQGPYALTWSQVSYSQLPFLPIVQIADLTGAFGISFLVVTVNATLAELFFWKRTRQTGEPLPRSLRGLAIGCALSTALCIGYGLSRLAAFPAHPVAPAVAGSTNEKTIASATTRSSEQTVRVACVQPSEDPYTRWTRGQGGRIVMELELLTREAARDGAQLIVWPETAVPESVLRNPPLVAELRNLATSLHVNVLIGSAEWTNPASTGTQPPPQPSRMLARETNSALLLTSRGSLNQRYDKMHLVPFGEYLPWRPVLGRLSIFAEGLPHDLAAGTVPTIFHLNLGTATLRFSTLICFESTFAAMARERMRAGAQFLVVITNDGWFGHTSAAAHHLAMTAMRAIEERTWVVQCGNTGISAFIDPGGHIHGQTALYLPTITTHTIAASAPGTVYEQFGDWFIGLTLALLGACAALGCRSTGRDA